MTQPSEDINMEIAIELYDKVKEICMETNKQQTPKPHKEVKKEPRKLEHKDFYQIIEKILMTGSNRLSEDMLEGLIAMLKVLGSKGDQTTNQEITTTKFYRLVMFNCTFYLSRHEGEKKHVFVNFVKAFVEYIKRILVRFKDNATNQNMDVLYNLWLNVLVALANPQNYAHQFKQVLKLNKYGFDLAEVKYLNDNLDKYLNEVDSDEEVSWSVHVLLC